MALTKVKGTGIKKKKLKRFLLPGELALLWLWTCSNADYEMNERAV
jgi:hypothetical protein